MSNALGDSALAFLAILASPAWAENSVPGAEVSAVPPRKFAPAASLRDYDARSVSVNALPADVIYLRNDSRQSVEVYLLDPLGSQAWERLTIGGAQDGELHAAGLWLAIGTRASSGGMRPIKDLDPNSLTSDGTDWFGYHVRILRRQSRYEICVSHPPSRWIAQPLRTGGCAWEQATANGQ
jgi:hypothetical protein